MSEAIVFHVNRGSQLDYDDVDIQYTWFSPGTPVSSTVYNWLVIT